MAQVLRGMLIRTIPHSDKAIICKIFTENQGYRAFYSRRSGKSNVSAIMQPLNTLEFSSHIKEGMALPHLTSPALVSHLPFGEPLKMAICMFISELLAQTLEDEYHNPELYKFLQTAVQILSAEELVGNFPIWFVAGLSREYGFSINTDPEIGEIHPMMCGEEARLCIAKIAEASYPELRAMIFSREVRREVLRTLVDRIQDHLGSHRPLRSIEYLEEVFH